MGYIINELFRFRMLMAGVYVGIAISSTYGFAVLTEDMRAKFDFSQSDITTISTVGNCVGYLSFFAGMLFDYAGPKVVFPIAGTLGLIGYVLFGLALDGSLGLKRDEKMKNTIYFSIFNAILYLGCPALDVATMMPLMMNFPLERGFMVIIQKTFSGLGTSVLMVYFNGFFRNMTDKEDSAYSGYVYFVGAEILFCAILGAIFIDLPPYVMTQYRRKRVSDEERREREATLKIFMTQNAPTRRLYIGCALVIVNLVFLTIVSIVTGYVQTQRSGYLAIAILAICILALFALMALPLQFLGRYTPVERRHSKYAILGHVSDPAKGLDLSPAALAAAAAGEEDQTRGGAAVPADAPQTEGGSSGAAEDSEKPQLWGAAADADVEQNGPCEPLEEVGEGDNANAADDGDAPKPIINSVGQPQYGGSFWQHLLTLDLWLLWLSFFGMWGTGTVMQMNATQIYRSKNYGVFDPARNTLNVALIGVGSAVGRIFSGVIDMYLLRRREREQKRAAESGVYNVPTGLSKYMMTTIFLPLGPILLCIAYLLFAVIPAGALILPFLVGAVGTGVGWGLGSLAVRIMYANDIGKHYNFMFSSGFICTIALNRFMFGEMYDSQARAEGTYPACNSPSCVRNQMFILMAVNALSTVTATLAHIRFARFTIAKTAALYELDAMNPTDNAAIAAQKDMPVAGIAAGGAVAGAGHESNNYSSNSNDSSRGQQEAEASTEMAESRGGHSQTPQ